MNIILYDTAVRDHLLPLTFTRPVADIRVGINTIREKWERCLPGRYSYKTEDYLSGKFPLTQAGENLVLNGAVCPHPRLVGAVGKLGSGESLVWQGVILAQKMDGDFTGWKDNFKEIPFEFEDDLHYIDRLWKIFSLNGPELERDFDEITEGRTSALLSSTNTILGDRVFAEEGAEAECAVLNATTGPIYLAKNSVVMEGTLVRGGLALGEHSQLKLGTKIYGPTTIGPWSKVGGEVNNSVIFGYSNKGHDGFLGNSVIGEWCNLGADTNNSNLKNNYEEVRLWNYSTGSFERTGLQFCGLIMGDHSKCGINTMFNTGTVVGVSANIFGSGFPRNFVDSFSWGGAGGFTAYKFDKAFATAERVMERRGIQPDAEDREILQYIFDNSAFGNKS